MLGFLLPATTCNAFVVAWFKADGITGVADGGAVNSGKMSAGMQTTRSPTPRRRSRWPGSNSVNNGDGTITETLRAALPLSPYPQCFLRVCIVQ